MKKNLIINVAMVAAAAIATLTSCVSSLYSSSGSYDDLYAVHDVEVIAAREKAEAQVRKAEAEARRAEALAEQAEWEAEQAKQNALLAQNQQLVQSQRVQTQSDGVIVVEEDNNSYVANSYESAYARRLRGFQSASYRMPSSYYSLRYNGNVTYATAYDPAFYNIMVSGDEVWVEPKYITSMFGTWGATRATVVLSPWYYGWHGWSSFYDPWYYSCWGFPRYSWWDWNWNICYRSHWGGWGVNLWWGWGGLYRPWHHHHYHGWYGHHHHHHHHGGFWYGDMWGGGGGHWNRGGSYYGSRNNNSRVTGGSLPSRGSSVVNRGSANSTPYRSPSSGSVYGNTSRSGRYASALEQQRNGSIGRGTSTGSRSQAAVGSSSTGRTTTTNRDEAYTNTNPSRNASTSRNTSVSRSTYNSNSSSSSSYSSGSSFSGSSRGGGFSGGSSGGGGSRSGGSRGR